MSVKFDNILVLGASGYLGSKLALHFANSGCNVFCACRDTNAIYRFSDNDYCKIVPADKDSLDSLLSSKKIDAVYNCICDYCKDNVLTESVLNANFLFPLSVLNSCSKYGVNSFFTMGTCIKDSLNLYGLTKNTLKSWGKYYAQNCGVNFTEIQLQMFYGPDEPDGRFINSSICKMLKGQEINMTTGLQKRDIIYVDDVLDAVEIISNSELIGYNEVQVGTGFSPSISDIIDYIWECTGSASQVNKGAVPARKNEPDCVADLTAICNLGNFQPLSWKEGLTKTIEILKENVNENSC